MKVRIASTLHLRRLRVIIQSPQRSKTFGTLLFCEFVMQEMIASSMPLRRLRVIIQSPQRCRDLDVLQALSSYESDGSLDRINDFSARSSLSGWSGQGYKACPTCNKDTPSVRVLGKTRFEKPGHSKWLVARQTKNEKYLEPQIRQRHIDNDPGVNESSELFALACGPSQTPISVNSCVVNGVRFVVHSRDERRTTQNSGICSPGPDEEMYYGQLEQILEFSYLSFKTVLFRRKDPYPHDLADSDDEDLVNLDIDDGVNVMSADVARGHGGDGGGDDRPPPYQVPTGCGGCLGNRGKGTRKPNLGGRRAGRPHTRQETRNLGLKAITDKSGPVPIRFEVNDRETLMPLGDHAAHWANYLRELVRELPLHYPSWRQMSPERKAGVVQRLGPSLTCGPTWNSTAATNLCGHSSYHLHKICNARRLLLKERYWVPERTGLMTWRAQTRSPSYILSKLGWQLAFAMNQMETPQLLESTGDDPHLFLTILLASLFLNPEDKALYVDEIAEATGLGSNTPTDALSTLESQLSTVVAGGEWRVLGMMSLEMDGTVGEDEEDVADS
ncbi:retrotransposon protein, putative, ty3-gypsy subclass [Tanacetum coccineum]